MARTACSKSKISIWWDIENCHVPQNVDPHHIAQNLRSALHHAGLNGPITIDLFADTRILAHKTLEALSSTGISINHISSGNKDAADKAILVAMLFWALDNPPPAHFLLISGDGDFANALHRLRLKGYDILLARPDQPVKPALLGAATSVWYWTNIAKGHIFVSERENVTKGQIPVSKDSKIIYEEPAPSKDLVNIELKNQKSLPDNCVSSSAAASKNTSAGKIPTFKDVANPLPGSVLSQKPGVSSRVVGAAKDVVSQDQPPLLNPANKAKPIAPDHKRTLKRLKKWLWQLPNLDEGYNISQVKKDFQQATGMALDPESLGYAKVIDILRDFSQDFLLVSPRKGLDLLFRNNKSQTMPAKK